MKKILYLILCCVACSWIPQGDKIEQILFDRENLKVDVGGSEFLAVDLLPEGADLDSGVHYSIADPSIAGCMGTNRSIKITGLQEGTTLLTAVCGQVVQSCLVSVEFGDLNSRYLTCDKTTVILEAGKEIPFTVELKNAKETEEAAITWQVHDTDICSLTGAGSTVILSPRTEGTTQLVVTHPQATNTLTVYVKVNPSDSALRLNTSFMVLDVGDDKTLTASSNETVSWAVLPEGIISLMGSGNTVMILAREPGTAIIQASTLTSTETCNVIVKADRMLEVSPSILDVSVGDTAMAYVACSPEDIEVIAQNSNPSVASFEFNPETGEILVTGINSGIATLNLVADGMQKILTVNVKVDYSLFCTPTILKIDPKNPGKLNYIVSPPSYIPVFTVADPSIAELVVDLENHIVSVTALKEGNTLLTGLVKNEHVNINIESWYSKLTCGITHKTLKKCDEDDDNARAKYSNGTLCLVDGLTQQLTLSFSQPGVLIHDIDWSFSSDLYEGIEYQIFESGKRIVFDFLVKNLFNHEEEGGNATVEIKWGDNKSWSKTIPIKVFLRNG